MAAVPFFLAVVAALASASGKEPTPIQVDILFDTGATKTYTNQIVIDKLPSGAMIQVFPKELQLCDSFMLVPGENTWSRGLLGILYFMALLYCFLGIAVIADVFMAAIEQITSSVKKVTRTNGATGEEDVFEIRVWNPTIANLTLMALGSSAPEILLATIGTITALLEDAPPDPLGPGTIVGSAAFNLLIIVAVCVIGVPEGETRRVEDVGVFAVTSFASIFAYIWVTVVLSINTKNVVDVWEAWVTFLFFPVLVCVAFAQDHGWWRGPKIEDDLTKMKVLGVERTVMRGGLSDEEISERVRLVAYMKMLDHNISEEQAKREAANEVAQDLLHEHRPKPSRLTYRMNAVKALSGAARIVPNNVDDPVAATSYAQHTRGAVKRRLHRDDMPVVSFAAPSYAVLESSGVLEVCVEVTRPEYSEDETDDKITVQYSTRSGTADADIDFVSVTGTLVFPSGVSQQTIAIEIIDDTEFEDDEDFYVLLEGAEGAQLGLSICSVTIIDDDMPGLLSFSSTKYTCTESDGEVRVQVVRSGSFTVACSIQYKTADLTAISGEDYIGTSGHLHFKEGEISKEIVIQVIDDDEFEREEYFTVQLFNPSTEVGIGEIPTATVAIQDNDDFEGLAQKAKFLFKDRMSRFGNRGQGSYAQQFKAAMNIGGTVNASGQRDDPGLMDYTMHFLTIFWKVIFATVPPTHIGGGWLAFFVALSYIGLLTMIIGEVAGTFGCVIGLDLGVTAITFVALGTSLPDLFASKTAATQDATADNAVGNVTGSNAVNVFLGLGLPWVIGTFWKASEGKPYEVPAGDLALGVMVFTLEAIICIVVLEIRRMPAFAGGELGGPMFCRVLTFVLFVLMWFIYILTASLKAYGHIDSPL